MRMSKKKLDDTSRRIPPKVVVIVVVVATLSCRRNFLMTRRFCVLSAIILPLVTAL